MFTKFTSNCFVKFKMAASYLISFCVSLILISCAGKSKTYNVYDYGAKGNGRDLDTKAINKTIETCSLKGGGTVEFPPGVYLSGSIHLKSNIDYHLEKGAVIWGAPNDINAYDSAEPNKWDKYQDYGHSHFHDALLWGSNLHNIIFNGKGMIDGGGITSGKPIPGGGDKAISLKLCTNVIIEDITIRQGGHIAILTTGCDSVEMNNLTIRTNRGALEIMECSNVNITNSNIVDIRYGKNGKMAGGDDAIGIKSDFALGRKLPSKNINIKNCFLSSGCNAIQFGSETTDSISNVHISNIKIVHADKAGLGITSNDGSVIENVTFTNISMSKVATPFFILITDRGRAPGNPAPGEIKNVTFNHITAFDVYGYIKNIKYTSTVSGLPGHPVENITFNDVKITYKGGGTKKEAEIIPPYTRKYQPRFLGIRPASGFYCRNADNLIFNNVKIGFEKPDLRPAFVMRNIYGLKLDDVLVRQFPGVNYDVVLKGVKNFSKKNSDELKVFMR